MIQAFLAIPLIAGATGILLWIIVKCIIICVMWLVRTVIEAIELYDC